ncbi:pilin [Pseudomonas eucalypticola]|uniref:Pilin n=1 Tax=Pseudomonas eucalypticola TaxID=2599595 RepID=A0A7D5I1U5_9PSED|nr:pilin [Pseudomonas eucalypticola]QKZ07791.1 pilin [Pseudomonas eucalypticola]
MSSSKLAQNGFTLIEVMVGVAIIGVLVAILIPNYMRYTAKSKVSGGLAELTALKPAVEEFVASSVGSFSLSDLGGSSNTSNCTMSLVASSGVVALSCTLVNPVYLIAGGVVSLVRSSEGIWTCEVNSNISQDFAPLGCTVFN